MVSSRTVKYLERLEVSEFYREQGHINIPQSKVIDGWKAGQWVGNLRQKYRRGELSAETIARAESLGVEWELKRAAGASTLERLEASEFYRAHGHINVPASAVINGWRAGQALAQLRARHRRGDLTVGVVARAESLGIDWNPMGYTSIAADAGLSLLEQSDFYREHGHINVPVSTIIGEWKAGMWLGQFKGEHRRGELPSRVVARAESLGIQWIKAPKIN